MPKQTIPEFVIDLNLAPENRFAELGHFYRRDLGVFLAEMRSAFTTEFLTHLEPSANFAGEVLVLIDILSKSGLPFPSIPFEPSEAVQILLKTAGLNNLESVFNIVLDASLWAFSKTLGAHEYMRELKWRAPSF